MGFAKTKQKKCELAEFMMAPQVMTKISLKNFPLGPRSPGVVFVQKKLQSSEGDSDFWAADLMCTFRFSGYDSLFPD
jgi:hypothetical protein